MVTLKQTENKLVKIKHQIDKSDFVDLKIDKKDFENLVKTEMIRQFADILVTKLDYKTTPTNSGGFEIEAEGFFFNRKEFYSLLIEISELNEEDRKELILSSRRQV